MSVTAVVEEPYAGSSYATMGKNKMRISQTRESLIMHQQIVNSRSDASGFEDHMEDLVQ